MNEVYLGILIVLNLALAICVLFVLCRHHKFVKQQSGLNENLKTEIRGIGFYVRIIAYIAIFFCVCVAIHYLAYMLPRQLDAQAQNTHIQNLGVDYLGLIVAIFAIIVTLLVGWQIYNTIKVKDEFDDLKKLKNETKQEVDKAVNRISRELWHLSPVFLSAHNDFLHRFEVNLNIFSATDNDSILAKSLSREFLLQSMMEIVKLSQLEQKGLIKSIKEKCDKKSIESLYLEFHTYSDKERNDTYKGLNNLFLELLKD